MRERITLDKETTRSGYHLLASEKFHLDHIVSQWSEDGSRNGRPLKVVFAGFLALVIAALAFQNITTELTILQAPYDRIKTASHELIQSHRAQVSGALTEIADDLASDPAFEAAISRNDTDAVSRIADHIFSHFNGDTGVFDLTIYSANRSILYNGGSSLADFTPSSPFFETDLEGSLFRTTNSLEFDTKGGIGVSALQPLVAEGRLLAYLKLTADVEKSMALLSAAVNGEILKAGSPLGPLRTLTPAGQEKSPSALSYRLLGTQTTSSATVQKILQTRSAPSWFHPVLIDGDRVLIAQDLPIDIVNGEAGSKLILIRDVTDNAMAFLKSMGISVLISLLFAVVAWRILTRLLNKFQQTIIRTRSNLEAEVLSNTRELERSQAQLLEAQSIASIGSWDGNLITKEISGSQEFFRILDIPSDTPPADIKKCFFEQISEPELYHVKLAVKTAIEQCGTFDFEHTIVRSDGTKARIHTQGHIIADENGRAISGIGTVHDITERSNTERQNKLMAKIMETSLNEIYLLNAETFEIEYANAVALQNLGYANEDIEQLKLWDISQEFKKDTIAQKLAPLTTQTQANYTAETYQRRQDGSEYPVDFQIQLVHDQGRHRFVAMANDISERVQRENETRDAKERAERLAYFDPLTKLSNRAGCQRDARKLFAEEDKPAFLIHVDMDNFKRVNDTLGHLAGDYCLAETGRRLREVSRGLGTPYRWGGDEFVILANSASADPNELCERARRLMRSPMEFNGTTFWPTVSMGIALCPDHGMEFDSLLVNADLALYRSKHNGKDRFTFFSLDMQTLSDTEAQLERELHMAAQRDEFFLVFQPQVNMRSHKVIGMEALVRWRHPKRGIVSPGEFLPVVEKTGFSSVLGEIVLDKAFAAARSWQDAGLDYGRISVNISPAHLSSGVLLDQFKDAMARHDLAPDRITAEVLESVFLDDDSSCHMTTLRDLYEMGVHVELDDFGTGYASLTHVVDLPINGLKIDRSFTQQLLEDHRKEIVINQLIHLARSLDIAVICEGVETEEQYDRLRMMGDFAVQGFLIAKPLPFEEATNWMADTAEDLYFVF
ncbi:EAL domain-containing protein [Labrenzia sp. PHM005]|uniref:sensor domain-containing protein n=1 Tax=Labrenzia sp. PHM005 TaxID=2590016 RepID=UPI001AD90152|nr:EAL domain-containing protein [Labrenzia sp. PHM005]